MKGSELLLQAWRIASEHNELGPAAAAIGSLLASQAPLSELAVYRIDAEHGVYARLASWPDVRGAPPPAPDPASIRGAAAWVKRRGAARISALAKAPKRLAALLSTDENALAAPLVKASSLGIAVFAPIVGKRFSSRHAKLFSSVCEALAVSLENDRRWHELAALREAAEADKRSLLRRLGRADLHEEIVGEATGLAGVMRRVNLVCASDAPVLLLGETGTGKEVVARAIHQRSDRRDGPFLRVNCGAIPPDLIDSQLFGHEKGAFTSAAEQRKGWFERADGGTLFLDEIGELRADAQVRFLRVLQDSLVERVGGGDSIRVDVRVVAATHRDLATMVQQGAFREDLWYRIAVFPVLLPPLRDRLEDLPQLAEHFVRKAAHRFGLPVAKLTEEDFVALRAYSWPGNVRELGAVIDRAAILGEGRRLEIAASLGFGVSAPSATRRTPAPTLGSVLPTLDEVARLHIEESLRQTRGRVEGPNGAAQILQINPHTLRARMRKLGVDWAAFRPT